MTAFGFFIVRGEKDMDRLTDDAHDKTQRDLKGKLK
jgi:hypothetical protein